MQSLWMVLGAFLFASMGVGVKFASADLHAFELVFYRGVVSVLIMGMLLRMRRTPILTPVPGMHAWRSLVGGLSLTAWFYAIAHLPLATAMTLNYMSGIWVAALLIGGSLLVIRDRPTSPPAGQYALLATVMAGFIGVVLTLRPTLESNQLMEGLIGLSSGLFAALAYMQVTALGRAGEPVTRTVFYFALGTLVTGALGVAAVGGLTPWSQMRWQSAAWIVPIGILATMGQWCMTRAYARGHTLVVASLQYSGIVFAALFSLMVFGDQIPWVGWLGMALIVASGVAATVLRERTLPDTPAEEH